jgi:hypothetical protein
MMRNMLSDPAFLESMASMGGGQPMMGMPPAFGGGFPPMFGGLPPGFPATMNSSTTSSPNLAGAGLDFSNVLGGMGITTATPVPNTSTSSSSTTTTSRPITTVQSPAERYASQVAQLQSMGFTDASANLEALVQTGGNINAAVERLLGSS